MKGNLKAGPMPVHVHIANYLFDGMRTMQAEHWINVSLVWRTSQRTLTSLQDVGPWMNLTQ